MVEIISGTDVLIALLYAKGSTGKINEPIAGTTKLEKFMFLLSRESQLKNAIKDYDFAPDNFGPCSHELFDDIEMLKDAKFIEEKETNVMSPLDEGDSNACQSAEIDSVEYPQRLRIFSLTTKGIKIGEILFNSMTPIDQQKIISLKQAYNKKPVSQIVRDVYKKYPEMIVESRIRDKILA